MKYCHQIKISVFSKPEDIEEKVKERLISLVPYDLAEEKIEVNQRSATGFSERKLRIFEVILTKQRHTQKFIKNLFSKFSKEQKELLKRQLKTRLDDNLHFFLRLDKLRLLDGEYFITDTGDCFHIKMSIAAFPAKREAAKKIVLEMIDS